MTLSTIGIGSDADTNLLQQLAQLGNGALLRRQRPVQSAAAGPQGCAAGAARSDRRAGRPAAGGVAAHPRSTASTPAACPTAARLCCHHAQAASQRRAGIRSARPDPERVAVRPGPRDGLDLRRQRTGGRRAGSSGPISVASGRRSSNAPPGRRTIPIARSTWRSRAARRGSRSMPRRGADDPAAALPELPADHRHAGRSARRAAAGDAAADRAGALRRPRHRSRTTACIELDVQQTDPSTGADRPAVERLRRAVLARVRGRPAPTTRLLEALATRTGGRVIQDPSRRWSTTSRRWARRGRCGRI